MELQSKMVDTKQKLKMADLQIENLKRTITHAGKQIIPNLNTLRYLVGPLLIPSKSLLEHLVLVVPHRLIYILIS